MKITKRQLRRIIKEEKARLLAESQTAGPPISGDHAIALGGSYGSPDLGDKTAKVNPGPALDALHTAIDGLVAAMGSEEARQELLGIVEDWEGEEVHEGTSPDNMPSAWKQILKGTLG